MKFHVVTIFPDMFGSYLKESIIGRAIKNKKISVKFYNPRDFTKDKHKNVDDKPYGGGPGMVMRAEPILRAVQKARGRKKKVKIILLSPSAKQFTNKYAKNLSQKYTDIILISGRYEGIDARVKRVLKAGEVSIGDYVLTGGELPAMVVIDVVSRQIEGVLGKKESLEESRISTSEVYTRPEILKYPPPGRGKKSKNYKVPKVLLSGHHKEIEKWRESRNGRKTSRKTDAK